MSSLWHVEMLGWLRVCGSEQVITRFRCRRTAAMVAYLATFRKHSHPREMLADLLWPEVDYDTSRVRLKRALWSVRRQLEPPGVVPNSVLAGDRQTVEFREATLTTDIEVFERYARQAALASSLEESFSKLKSAEALYRGDFLPGIYDDWAILERERLSSQYHAVLMELAETAQRLGEPTESLEYARRLTSADPLNERAHLLVMERLLEIGEAAHALRHFEQLEAILDSELGDTPSEEARALQNRALKERRSPSPASASTPTSRSTPRSAPDASRQDLATPQTVLLPFPVNRFFGREADVNRIRELFHEGRTRLVSLVGPGGSGKTRLAIEAASHTKALFPGGVWFVPLIDLADPRQIPQAIRKALALPPGADHEAFEQVAGRLRHASRPTLLVLDNFEHLAQGAEIVHELLARVPEVRCLLTSRHKLKIDGECEHPVNPLAHRPRETDDSLQALSAIPSVQLFIDRAQAVQSFFQITKQNADAIVAICEKLEGIPLAIELAAAWSSVLSPGQLLNRLEHRLEFLTTRRKDVPNRHRSFRLAIEHSVQMLSPELQALFFRLSIFQGGFTLESASEVFRAGGDVLESQEVISPATFAEMLQSLRECSLISVESTEEGLRFRMLETLREYGQEALTPSDRATLSRAHADYFTAQTLHFPIREFFKRPTLQHRFETELANYELAFQSSLRLSRAEPLLRIGVLLAATLFTRSAYSEARLRLESALQIAVGPELDRLRLECLCLLASTAIQEYRPHEGVRHAQESLAIAERHRDREGLAQSLYLLGACSIEAGDFAPVVAYAERSVQIYRELGDEAGIAKSLGLLAHYALFVENDFEKFFGYCAQELELYRRDPLSALPMSYCLNRIGAAHQLREEYDRAVPYFEEALAHARLSEVGFLICLCLQTLGECEGARKNKLQAIRYLQEASEIVLQRHMQWEILSLLHTVAHTLRELGEYELAAKVFGSLEAACLRREETHPSPSNPRDDEKLRHRLLEALGSEQFERYRRTGSLLPEREALALLFGEYSHPSTRP